MVNSQSQAAAMSAMSAAAQQFLPVSGASAVSGFNLQTAQLASLGQFGAMSDPYLSAIGVSPSVAYVSIIFIFSYFLLIHSKQCFLLACSLPRRESLYAVLALVFLRFGMSTT